MTSHVTHMEGKPQINHPADYDRKGDLFDNAMRKPINITHVFSLHLLNTIIILTCTGSWKDSPTFAGVFTYLGNLAKTGKWPLHFLVKPRGMPPVAY